MSSIQYNNNSAIITKNQHPNAIAYLQEDAPGYQVDFRNIDRVNDPSMIMDEDCRLYGVNETAIQICLKKDGPSILAGTPLTQDIANRSVEFMS